MKRTVFFLACMASCSAASRYWVGGGSGATWASTSPTNWAASSGGPNNASVPTSADDVFFDSNAGAGSSHISASIAINSLNMTGSTATLIHDAGATLTIAGGGVAFTLASRKYVLGNPATSALLFSGTSGITTLTTAGNNLGNLTFDGAGGTWAMADGVTTDPTAQVTLNNGSLHTDGPSDNSGLTHFWGLFSSDASTTRTLNLGASYIQITQGYANDAWDVTPLNLTLAAGTSTINIVGVGSGFAGGPVTTQYNNVIVSPTFSAILLTPTTIKNLTVMGPAVKDYQVSFLSPITITGTLTLTGNSPVNRIFVNSNGEGTDSPAPSPTAITLSGPSAKVVVQNADFQDISFATANGGPPMPLDLSAIPGNSGDCGGNVNITFTPSAPQTWSGASSGAWSTNAWTTRMPLPQDDVTIPSANMTVTTDVPRLGRNITWTGSSGSPVWAFDGVFLNYFSHDIYGSLTLIPNLTLSGTRSVAFNNRVPGTLTNAGTTWPVNVSFQMLGGTMTFHDSFSGSANVFLLNGTLDAGGFDFTAASFDSSEVSVRTLTMGTGSWTLTGQGDIWDVSSTTGLTLHPGMGSGTIYITDTSSAMKIFNGGGLAYNNLHLTPGGSGAVVFTGANTFETFTATGPEIITFPPGQTTVAAFNVSGTAGNLVTMSAQSGTATIFQGSGTVSCDYLNLTNIGAAGVTPFYAGTHSTDGGGNRGWLFTAPSGGQPASITLAGVSPASVGLSTGSALSVVIAVTRVNYPGSLGIGLGSLPTGVTAVLTGPLTNATGGIQLSADSNAPSVTNYTVTFSVFGSGVSTVNGSFLLTVSPGPGLPTFATLAAAGGVAAQTNGLAVGPDGSVYLLALSSNGLGIWKSANKGATFSGPVIVPNSTSPGFGYQFAVDQAGTIHVVWGQAAQSTTETYYSQSRNGGASFTTPIAVRSGAAFGGYTASSATSPVVAADGAGNVYVAFSASTRDASNTFIDYDVWLARSADGGLTFQPEYYVTTPAPPQRTPIRIYCSFTNYYILFSDDTNHDLYFSEGTPATGGNDATRINATAGKFTSGADLAFDAPGENLYAAFTDATTHPQGDITVCRSNNGGSAWANCAHANDSSTGLRENPALALDTYGILHTVWDDLRSGVKTQLYYSRSTDGAVTFAPNVDLTSDQPSDSFTLARAAVDQQNMLLYVSAIKDAQQVVLSHAALAAAQAGVSPGSLTFASQAVGSSSTSQNVTVTNSGPTLTITSIAITGANPGDFRESNNCPATLANGANCTISVTFTPTTTGARSAAVTITDTGTGSPHAVILSGTGAAAGVPAVSLTSSALTFSSQNVGTTSAGQTVTLTNTGGAVLSIASIAVTGVNSGDFTETNTCGTSLAPAANCGVSVTFHPLAAGARSASVTITDNAAGSPQSFTLGGTGVGVPAVSLSSSTLTFTGQVSDTSSPSQPVTLTNTGTEALSIASIAVTGTNPGDFGQTNTCGTALPAGGNCTISVKFTPTATGSRGAAVTITDNAAGSPHTISLSGTGLGPGGAPVETDVAISNLYAAAWNDFNGTTFRSTTYAISSTSTGTDTEALLRFDGIVVPVGTAITSATLQLSFNSYDVVQLLGYYIESPWEVNSAQLGWLKSGDTTLWKTSGAVGDVYPGVSFSTGVLAGTGQQTVTITLDPTTLNQAINTTSGSLSLMLTGVTPNAVVTLYSGTYSVAAQHPMLSIKTGPAPPAIGSIDAPVNNTTGITGAVSVTGWALSWAGVKAIALWREPVNGEPAAANGLVFISNVAIVPGSRPDVAAAYPGYPSNTSGYGGQILTNELPNTMGTAGVGNGTWKIHVIVTDNGGEATDIGVRTISANNAQAVLPFGTIDTPATGGTASGTSFVNFGWAVTPNPSNIIPKDGSTITVYIDNVPAGHPVYNNYRSDIATLFPGLQNSNGAVGYLRIDTTKLTNGLHSISWAVKDSAGNKQGLGSRFFIVNN